MILSDGFCEVIKKREGFNMSILFIPPKNNYPSPNVCLELIGQGFPYLAGALKAAGHDVFSVNLSYQWCGTSAYEKLKEEIVAAIRAHRPELIGVGGLTADYKFVRDAVKCCREVAPNIPIVCGGNIFTQDSEFIFHALQPNFGLIGEAEDTIVSLLNAVSSGHGLKEIQNLWYWENGKVVKNPTVHSKKNLDEYPLPDYQPFDIDKFLELQNQPSTHVFSHTEKHPRIMPISLGRYCPFKCTFCCHFDGRKYRSRTVEHLIEEIKQLYARYQFNILIIYDELFSADKSKVWHFCSCLRKLDFKFRWHCAFRVTDVDKDLLKEMKETGCATIAFGLESASPTVLKSMNKRISPEEIKKAIEMTAEAEIGFYANFIFGDPAETIETIKESMTFYYNYCSQVMIGFIYILPYPGSQIFQYAVDNGIISDRQLYYDEIGGMGHTGYNLTKMSDKEFYGFVDPIIQRQDNFDKRALAYCIAKSQEDVLAADKALPNENLHRIMYDLSLTCPYCKKHISYLYPLPKIMSKKCYNSLLLCVECHKQFRIKILVNVKEEDLLDDESISKIDEVFSINPQAPRLIETYQNYNLVEYCSLIYACNHNLGSIDLCSVGKEELAVYKAENRLFVCKTAEEARRKIDFPESAICEADDSGKQFLSYIDPHVPRLIETYRKYNLVAHGALIYACRQSMGQIDLSLISEKELKKHQARKRIFVCQTVLEAKNKINSKSRWF